MTYVSSQMFLKINNVSDVELARQLAIVIIENYPADQQKTHFKLI